MRTTLTIDDDILEAAKDLAARDKRTVGEMLSELARKGLKPVTEPQRYRNGVPLMPVRPGSGVVTLEMVNRLRDEEDW
jgi:hypothetical protein